jgi:hypothetical protein
MINTMRTWLADALERVARVIRPDEGGGPKPVR